FHAVERVERVFELQRRRQDAAIAEIDRTEQRRQQEADVGRRCAPRRDAARILLEVVGRQPLVGGADERLEERPGTARENAQPAYIARGQRRRTRRPRLAEQVRDLRRAQPQQQQGGGDKEGLRAERCGQ